MEGLAEIGFDGYSVGGLSVGEPPPEMWALLDEFAPQMPADRPRYLMGVGRPVDLVHAVAAGIDQFDCVLPTRNGPKGLRVHRRRARYGCGNNRHRLSDDALDSECGVLYVPALLARIPAALDHVRRGAWRRAGFVA